ncbi:MAG: tRNA threonylcarbamoyladenosine biosynthesis protein TsaB, partial [Limisphaerales bacterium]
MKILAVEFSSERRSVAVVENGRVLGEAFEMGGRAAIALVERALATSNVDREQIECIAVGTGPGSYTGIRGAISLAQGWQL